MLESRSQPCPFVKENASEGQRGQSYDREYRDKDMGHRFIDFFDVIIMISVFVVWVSAVKVRMSLEFASGTFKTMRTYATHMAFLIADAAALIETQVYTQIGPFAFETGSIWRTHTFRMVIFRI